MGGPRIAGQHRGTGRWACARRVMIAVILWACVVPGFVAAKGQSDVRVLLRYDDYTRDSPAVMEQHWLAGLESMGVPVLVGVLPFPGQPYPASTSDALPLPLDLGQGKQALLATMQARGSVEIALHGFNHQTNSTVDGHPSEFAGLGLERQRQLMVLGRAALERALAAPVHVFIPPFNTFDANTVRAVKEAGLTVLSSGVTAVEGANSLVLVPGTVYPQQMREVIRQALHHDYGPVLLVVVTHPYDFAGSGEVMPAFRRHRSQMKVDALLEDVRWARSQPGVKFISLSGELAGGADLSPARVAANVALRQTIDAVSRLLSPVLAQPPVDGMLLSTEAAQTLRWKALGWIFGLALVTVGTAFIFSRWLNRQEMLRRTRRLQRALLAVVFAAVLALGAVNGFYFLKALLLVSCVGWLFGTRQGSS